MTNRDTRYCPTCNSADLVIEFDDPLLNAWSTISCKECGHTLQIERLDAPIWEDPSWVASGAHSVLSGTAPHTHKRRSEKP